mgnify:FL=1
MKIIGETRKEAREKIGISIEEASEDLKIRPSQLQEIENGDFKSFKDVFYLKNFIKEYSKYLGLDSVEIIDEFNEFLFDYTSKIPMDKIEEAIKVAEKDRKNEVVSPYTKVNKTKKSSILMVSICLVIGILVLFIIYFLVQQLNVKNNAKDSISMNIFEKEAEYIELA